LVIKVQLIVNDRTDNFKIFDSILLSQLTARNRRCIFCFIRSISWFPSGVRKLPICSSGGGIPI